MRCDEDCFHCKYDDCIKGLSLSKPKKKKKAAKPKLTAEEKRVKANEYAKQWRHDHPGYHLNYQRTHREQCAAANRRWQKKNPDKMKEIRKRSYEKTKEARRLEKEKAKNDAANQQGDINSVDVSNPR